MPLEPGQKVKAEMMKITLTVKRKLGEGTQGEVYLVDGPHGQQALKWYKPAQATLDQIAAIRALVQAGPPRGAAGARFIWPLDLVTAQGQPQFGYLMRLIDTSRFAELGEVQAHLKPVPGFRSLTRISYQLANSYRALHLSGLCYRDISDGNLMFDPIGGEILICDNDNVGVNRQSRSQVWGTMEYMAPEIIRGEADPSTETDLHSLAVLLFNLWCWHHPFHGRMEYELRVWDIPAKRKVYGNPVFIFNPADSRNSPPPDPDYQTVRARWGYCPASLRDLFTRAFTAGVHEPRRRVTEGEWQRLFLQLSDGTIPCPSCRAENIWEPGGKILACWNCSSSIPLPPKLVVTTSFGTHHVLLTDGATIAQSVITPGSRDDADPAPVGQVVRNPADPAIWGIRNLSRVVWHVIFPDGQSLDVPSQKSVPLNPGTRIDMGGVSAEIIL
ncbi:MAG: serine/threonine-protein kinase [Methanomicrobiales archaeon]|jgi:serine/threonine protein kinase